MTEEDLDAIRSRWRDRAMSHQNSVAAQTNLWRYLELVRTHAKEGVNDYKALLFFTLPLAVRARRMVELGSSFSYFPDTYTDGSPWGTSSSQDEGLVSTRLMLSACLLLSRLGVDARLTSVDIRTKPGARIGRDLEAAAHDLIGSLELHKFWEFLTGTDTLVWLAEEQKRLERGETQPIDFVLVDSNHTYDQVSRELESVLPLLSPRAVILVDDCYETNYQHGASWIPEDSLEGQRRGGEYGAILEFLAAHPQWRAEWFEFNMLLTRA